METDTRTLTVLIVNWNRCADLMRLLNDLDQQTHPPDEIIVVDNGSTDGSPETIAQAAPQVRLIRLHKNMGLSFGRNVGIVAATAEAIAVLDNDLRLLDKGFLAKVRQSLAAHADCGVISFACIQGLWQKPPAGFKGSVFTMSELLSLAAKGEGPVEPRAFYDWFFLGGACVVRRSVFQQVGLFDDIFNYGGEEWDFAYRCHAAGLRLLRDESLWVVHVRSPQMRSKSNLELILKNMVVAQSRHMPVSDLLLFLVMQSMKSAADAVRQRRIRASLRVGLELIVTWRKRVTRHRQPVSRETMQRFYYLRTHQPDAYDEVSRSTMTGRQFYTHRAELLKSQTEMSPNWYVAFYEQANLHTGKPSSR